MNAYKHFACLFALSLCALGCRGGEHEAYIGTKTRYANESQRLIAIEVPQREELDVVDSAEYQDVQRKLDKLNTRHDHSKREMRLQDERIVELERDVKDAKRLTEEKAQECAYLQRRLREALNDVSQLKKELGSKDRAISSLERDQRAQEVKVKELEQQLVINSSPRPALPNGVALGDTFYDEFRRLMKVVRLNLVQENPDVYSYTSVQVGH